MDQYLTLCGMDETAHALFGIYCAKQGSEQRLAQWFAETEFEALRPEVSCMAAAISTAQNDCGAPKELLPRLRGIMRYVHTLNSGMAAGLLAFGKQCNQAELPVMLLGGTAIHFSRANPPQRHRWKMELCVSEEEFDRVAELAKNAGFSAEQTPYSLTARKGNTQCLSIRKGMERTQETASLRIGEVSFLMPDRAQLPVDLAQIGFETLLNSRASLLPWLMDLHCLVREKPDWNAVADIAKRRGASVEVGLMLQLYCKLTSASEDMLPLFCTEAQSARLLQLLLKHRACKPDGLRHRCLSVQIRHGVSPLGALWHIATGKLTRGNENPAQPPADCFRTP